MRKILADRAAEPLPKPSLRTAQKESTRERIREAARALFYADGYAAVTVEQIALAAGASRATFYLHFKDKEEVLQSMAIDYTPRALAVMRRLSGPLPTRDAIVDWLGEWVTLIAAENVSLTIFTEVGQSESGLPPYIQSIQDHVIGVLAESLAAFRAATLPGPLQYEANVRAELLILMASKVCGRAAKNRDGKYNDMAIGIVASFFEGFIGDPRFSNAGEICPGGA